MTGHLTNRTRAFKFISLIIVLAIALYAGYWFSMAKSFENSIIAWQKNINDNGGTLSYDKLTVSGFPLQLNTKVVGLKASMPDEAKWEISSLETKINPFEPLNLSLNAVGENKFVAGITSPIPFNMKFDNLSIKNIYSSTTTEQKVSFSVDNIGIDQSEDNPDQSMVLDNIHLMFTIKPALMTTMPTLPIIQAWKEHDGTVTLDNFSIEKGDISTSLVGTASLDDDFQPQFSGELAVIGLIPLLNQLKEDKKINERMTNLIIGFVKMLNSGEDIADNQPLMAPVSIKQKKLFVGPFPVFGIPALNWSEINDIHVTPNKKTVEDETLD